MDFEVIRDIKNECKNNSMRDIFFQEISTDDPDKWMREQENKAHEITREDFDGGIRYRVFAGDMLTVYTLTEI